MKWLMQFYHERRGILARYGIEAPLPAEAVLLGWKAVLAEHPLTAGAPGGSGLPRSGGPVRIRIARRPLPPRGPRPSLRCRAIRHGGSYCSLDAWRRLGASIGRTSRDAGASPCCGGWCTGTPPMVIDSAGNGGGHSEVKRPFVRLLATIWTP
jgi:hypothetical protein